MDRMEFTSVLNVTRSQSDDFWSYNFNAGDVEKKQKKFLPGVDPTTLKFATTINASVVE
jgi:hypothetical protein